MNKKGPFIQDEEIDKTYQSDNHYRCKTCNYSNMGYHDTDLISLIGPSTDRQMFMDKLSSDIYCNCCVATEVRFEDWDSWDLKDTNLVPLRRPNKGFYVDTPIFDNSKFAARMREDEGDSNDNDEDYKFLEDNYQFYSFNEWDEIIEKDGFKIEEI